LKKIVVQWLKKDDFISNSILTDGLLLKHDVFAKLRAFIIGAQSIVVCGEWCPGVVGPEKSP
jgi:hypothetical protein